MNTEELMTQGEFAGFYEVSQPMISRYIQQHKIPPECLKKVGQYTKIIVDCAVQALEENLSPIKRKSRQTKKDRDFEAMAEYEEFISFDPHDHDELSTRLGLALDTLSIISESMNPDIKAEMENHLDAIAGIFGARRVYVENIVGKRCIPVDAL